MAAVHPIARGNARDWLEALARLSTDDLARISRLVDLLVVADRAASDTAGAMLDAPPAPGTHDDARDRLAAVIGDNALADNTHARTTAEILARIDQIQTVQRSNPPTSAAWQRASDELAPLFEEMARRAGGAS